MGRPDPYLPLMDHGPDSSINAVLQSSLKQPELAQPLSAWLGKLPYDRPILVGAQPGNTSAVFAADMMSYLAWPRRVEISWEQRPGELKFLHPLEFYGAVGWCRMEPRPAKFKKVFGPNLTFGSDSPLPE